MSGPGPQPIRVTVAEDTPPGIRADAYISERLGLISRSQVKRRVSELRINGRLAKPGRHLHPGDLLEFVCAPEPSPELLPEAIQLRILYEDENVVVVDKQQGMVVHPAAGNRSGTLVNALLHHCAGLSSAFSADESRPGIVHRLDKDTSGVIIAAKNARSRELLSLQFRSRSVQKRYLAIVRGAPPSSRGWIDTWIARDPHQRKRFTCLLPGSGASRGKRALTFYRELRRIDGHTLVALWPRSGRTHQLRVHMAHLGCPIVGDRLYGWRARGGGEWTLMLHARMLRIVLPGQSDPTTFRADLPRRFRAFYNFSLK